MRESDEGFDTLRVRDLFRIKFDLKIFQNDSLFLSQKAQKSLVISPQKSNKIDTKKNKKSMIERIKV